MYPGHGTMFVRNDSKAFRFCGSKCNRMFKRKSNPRKKRWTKTYRKCVGKDLTVDPAFEFEKRRNAPVKYNRELWGKTLQAMKRVTEIKKRREDKFIMDRLLLDQDQRRVKDLVHVRRGMNLIVLPAAGLRKGRVVLEEKMEEKDEVTKRIEAGVAAERRRMKQEEQVKIANEEMMSEDEEKIEEDHQPKEGSSKDIEDEVDMSDDESDDDDENIVDNPIDINDDDDDDDDDDYDDDRDAAAAAAAAEVDDDDDDDDE
ncbi:hypothetical protein Pcinc_027273 [Petrolisthes cinctipes]|uniref:Probable ribosome biogenesis protein RLP24 n=1 Tax=Petrolisthes cinctipes TaxID=88211 RepID=A0AAE1F5H8_PETCI|nr:hypothetical protein Pcinc_027273 [Petrolisthes cinctipes]